MLVDQGHSSDQSKNLMTRVDAVRVERDDEPTTAQKKVWLSSDTIASCCDDQETVVIIPWLDSSCDFVSWVTYNVKYAR